jgi:hypothetical protein
VRHHTHSSNQHVFVTVCRQTKVGSLGCVSLCGTDVLLLLPIDRIPAEFVDGPSCGALRCCGRSTQ